MTATAAWYVLLYKEQLKESGPDSYPGLIFYYEIIFSLTLPSGEGVVDRIELIKTHIEPLFDETKEKDVQI